MKCNARSTGVTAFAFLAAFYMVLDNCQAQVASFAARKQAYCDQKGALCGQQQGRLATDKELHAVNRRVNRMIRYAPDDGDVWSANVRRGDCEEYVLAKRAALVRAGVATSSMIVRVVHVRRDEYHMTLVVKSASGRVLELDNMARSNKKLRPVSRSPYRQIATISGDMRSIRPGSGLSFR